MTRLHAADLTADQMCDALTSAGEADRPTMQAATHLLTFTELPGRADFAHHVDLVELDEEDPTTTAAYVHDWPALLSAELRMADSSRRLLALAASLARGLPVDLRDALAGLGHAHARRVIEAMMIATGAVEEEWYGLTEGPGLERLRAFHRAMSGGSPAD